MCYGMFVVLKEAIYMTRHKWTQEEIQNVVNDRKNGMLGKDIAKKYNVSYASIRKILTKNDVHLDKDARRILNQDSELVEQVRKLKTEGVTEEEIGHRLGKTKNQIYHISRINKIRIDSDVRSQISTVYTPEQTEKVLSLRKQGVSLASISQQTGLSEHTVEYLTRKHNVKVTVEQHVKNRLESQQGRTYYSPEIVKQIIALRTEGFPLLDIVEKFDSSMSAIKRIVLLANINLSPEAKAKNQHLAFLRRNNVKSVDELMEILAAQNEGKYLGGYVDWQSKVKWQCKKGHIFEARVTNVNQKCWCPICWQSHNSRGQMEVYEYVCSLVGKDKVVLADRKAIYPKELDVYVPELKVGFEYNGNFWHSSGAVGYSKNKHYDKFQRCGKAGIKLFAIYSDEWENNKDLVKAMIRWRLGKFNGIALNARDLKLVKLDKNKQFKSFFERNHLDGHAKATFAYGLYDQDKLVACASFRKGFTGEFELARLATDYDYNVRGAPGKLLSLISEPLMSYSSNRLGSGQVYENLGFKLIDSAPRIGYWYTDGKNRVRREKCRRDNTPEVIAKYPTEKAQALAGIFSQKCFGHDKPLFKIHDYGNKKWLLTPKFK